MTETIVQGDKVIEKQGGKVVSEKDYNHVIQGYQSTLARDNTSKEAKQHAQERIDELEASHVKAYGGDSDKMEEEKHRHFVITGLKASIHNPNVSEEAKEHSRQTLSDMGVDFEE